MNSSLISLNTSPRRHRSLGEATDLVEAWRTSGVSKGVWCRSQGITISTLQSCLKRMCRQASAVEVHAVPGFIVVHPPRTVAAGEVRIELGGGAQILGLDVDGVIAVLRGLRERSL